MSEKKWHAVYTRVRWEKKVAELLSKKHIENYCPLNKVERQWADRKKVILKPLFTSYVFVKLSPIEHVNTIQTDGIINFVYWLGKPAIIRDLEIETIQRFLEDHTNVVLEKTTVNVNDHVRVVSGPLIEQEGQVIEIKTKTIKIILPTLGWMMSAEVERSKVEVIKSTLLRQVKAQNTLKRDNHEMGTLVHNLQ